MLDAGIGNNNAGNAVGKSNWRGCSSQKYYCGGNRQQCDGTFHKSLSS
jgi:hypothetical protein